MRRGTTDISSELKMSGQNQNLEHRANSHLGFKAKIAIVGASLVGLAAAAFVPIRNEVISTSRYEVSGVVHYQEGVGYNVVKTLEGDPHYGGAFESYKIDPSLRSLENGDTVTFREIEGKSLLGYGWRRNMEVEINPKE